MKTTTALNISETQVTYIDPKKKFARKLNQNLMKENISILYEFLN